MLYLLKFKNAFLSALSGLLIGLSWPTHGFSFLIFVAFVPLLIVEENINKGSSLEKNRKVFGYSFFAFAIWHAISIWWTWHSTILGMILLVLCHSTFQALLFLAYHKIRARVSAKHAIFFLSCIWMSFEKLDMEWELSLPWLHLGNVFSTLPTWVQWYEYTGAFGGSLWVWLTNGILFLGILKYRKYHKALILKRQGIVLPLAIFLPIVISVTMFERYNENGDTVSVKVLQPNIDPYEEKYNYSNQQMYNMISDLASVSKTDSIDFVISPETTLPNGLNISLLKSNDIIKNFKRDLLKNPNTNFLIGLVLYRIVFKDSLSNEYSSKITDNRWRNSYNSAVLVNKSNSLQIYHKSKPLVGVESIPYKTIVKPLFGELLFDFGGANTSITPQKKKTVFVGINPHHLVAPIICYESIYGSFVTEYVQKGANFLAIITNDGWWGNSKGHRQHLSYARLRAIETRRSIARSANTGISAIINQKGEIVDSLAYGEKGYIDGVLHLNSQKTFYVRHGDYIPRIAVLTAMILIGIAYRKKI